MSDNKELMKRIRNARLNVFFGLPLAIFVSFYGWEKVKFLFGVGQPDVVYYCSFSMTAATTIIALFPVFITSGWYVTKQREVPSSLEKILKDIFTVTFLSWILLAFPFHMYATAKLEESNYIRCQQYYMRGVYPYALDKSFCPN